MEPWELARQATFWRDKALILKQAHEAQQASIFSQQFNRFMGGR